MTGEAKQMTGEAKQMTGEAKQSSASRASSLAVLQDCMPTVCLIVAVAVMTITAWQVDDALESSREVHTIRDAVVADLVAEEAAFAAVERLAKKDCPEVLSLPSPSGLTATVRVKKTPGQSVLRLSIPGRRERKYEYECELLPGAGPDVLGSPLNVRHAFVAERPTLRRFLRDNPGIRFDPMADHVVPGLLEPQYRAASTASKVDGFTEEDSIALLRLENGTDRRDFVPTVLSNGTWRPKVPADGVCVVPGNLWIDNQERPLRVILPRSLTVVVQGNLYLGRTILIQGPGRLVFVAATPDEASAKATPADNYLDLDGNGGWSKGDRLEGGGDPKTFRGPVEGQGAAYLGLPGTKTPQLDVAVSVVAAGEVYVHADRTRLRGALVAGRGLTWRQGCRLELPGSALPNVERESLPGFRRTGGARPGMLREVR